ncbi:MAG TPA: hypothetical protein VE619_05170, partial [Nitrososphaeraceae archaeon]|nr:hypothetical protein [Nitrososphaeraceae archaeon]
MNSIFKENQSKLAAKQKVMVYSTYYSNILMALMWQSCIFVWWNQFADVALAVICYAKYHKRGSYLKIL